MEAITHNNELAVIENSLEVLKAGPSILITNRNRMEKAIMVGNNILQAIKEHGMSPELDERANNYLANCSKALKEMKEGRAELTQIMDELKKMFTKIENDLDAKKDGTIPAQIQKERDEYAKQLALEKKRKEEESAKAAAKSKEEIEIRTSIGKAINDQLINSLSRKKNAIINAFNSITLETFSAKQEGLINMSTTVESDVLANSIDVNFFSIKTVFHDEAEVEAIVNAVMQAFDYNSFITSVWEVQLQTLKQELIDKLPSKKAELEEAKRLADEAEKARLKAEEEERLRQAEIAKADEAEKKRLQEEARIAKEAADKRQAELKAQQEAAEAEKLKREQEDADRIAREAEDAKKKAEQEAEIKKQGEITMTLFEQEAAIADAPQSPETRQGYEITVLHPAGWVQIFQLWFETEGKNLPVDKIGNTKMDQMKAWAEKHTHKNNVKIESKFIKYEESFKAVNRKAK